ncbi:hypothetical protein ASE75_13720 [Sphingomonas sp. Leaf17]|uniref:hypothetical protein n=1 Tax=Sphingomonas sp. Leaf17 TaxID=1735683 RepID=UPI0006F5DCB4|nr:hypothetical protein [Sphingomonas sp. Leaf17]KQM62683.1 hypothetical protein ASE75_13720 [Sphingomonas sp. Leaf17]
MFLQKLLPIVYWIVALGVMAFAFWRGGRDEKRGAVLLMLGSLASLIAVVNIPVSGRLSAVQSTIFGIDVLILVAFTALALRTDRFWPLWATAFHSIAVATHLASFLSPQIVPRAYLIAQGMWAYPMWAAILIGTVNAARWSAHGRRTAPPAKTKPIDDASSSPAAS